MDKIEKQKKELFQAVAKSNVFFHSTFDDFEEFDFEKSDFGMHSGTKESALNRIKVKIEEAERMGGGVLKNKKDYPILIEVELKYNNPLKLKENRTGSWLPHDVLREVMEQAESEGLKGVTKKEIEDYNQDELSLNGILFVDVAFEEDYEGVLFNSKLKEHYFIRNWLESKGYDAILYDNEFEKGGESIIVLRPEQMNIKEKVHLNPEKKPNNKRKNSI